MFSKSSSIRRRLVLKRSESSDRSKSFHEDSLAKQKQSKPIVENICSKIPTILEAHKSGVFSSDKFNEAIMFIFKSFTNFEEESLEQRQEIRSEIAEIVQKSKMAYHMIEIFRKCIEKGLPSRFNANTMPMTEYICPSLQILQIMDNFTSCSHEFCKAIVSETELLEIIFPFLREVEEEFIKDFRNEVIKKLVESCVSISYNIVKHDDLEFIDKMQVTGMFTAMKPYLKSSDIKLRMGVLMFFAYIVNEDEASEYCTDDESLRLILKNLEIAMKDKDKQSNGRTFLDILRVISKLASLDSCKKKLGDLGAMKIMEQIIQYGECGEAALTCKVVARLAFEPENAKRIVDRKLDCLIRIKSHEFLKIQEASVNFERIMHLSHDTGGTPKRKHGKHIMISYASLSHPEIVVKIKDAVTKKGFKVWFDDEKMKYYRTVEEAMANAIEESWLVLICCSWHYKQSDNCQLEATYTRNRKIEMLYLKMDSYNPDGWLGLLMSGKYYFDFSGTYPFEKKCDELLKRISQLDSKTDVAGMAGHREVSKIDEVSELDSPEESTPLDKCKDDNKGKQCEEETSRPGTVTFSLDYEDD